MKLRIFGFGGPKVGDYVQNYGVDPRGFGGGGFGSPAMVNPFALGQGIGLASMGKPQQETLFDQTDDEQNNSGPFSQLGHAIAGGAGAVGGAVGGAAGAVGDFIGWDQMKPMEKAQILATGIGGLADIYGSYKQGKLEDEERKKRQRSAEALRPYITSLMDKFGS